MRVPEDASAVELDAPEICPEDPWLGVTAFGRVAS